MANATEWMNQGTESSAFDVGNGYMSAALTNVHRLSPRMAADLHKVTQTGLNNPSYAAVARLQADCRAVGVKKPVWPDSLTGN